MDEKCVEFWGARNTEEESKGMEKILIERKSCFANFLRVCNYYEIKYCNFRYNFVHEFYWRRKGDGEA